VKLLGIGEASLNRLFSPRVDKLASKRKGEFAGIVFVVLPDMPIQVFRLL
jgi:hypothetical protein